MPSAAATSSPAPGDDGDCPAPHRVGALESTDLEDIVDEWGLQSFPASDPPANW
jgi:hypothetical protein